MRLVWIAIGVYLAIGSIYDKKSLTLPGWFLRIGCLVGIVCGIYRVFCGEIIWQQWITACLPGILWIIITFVTKEQMGYGDGVILLIVGSLTDVEVTFQLLMLGLGVGCICGMCLLVSKRGNRHTALPFVPMLFLAYLLITGGQLLL